jgi:hypothetical protein
VAQSGRSDNNRSKNAGKRCGSYRVIKFDMDKFRIGGNPTVDVYRQAPRNLNIAPSCR